MRRLNQIIGCGALAMMTAPGMADPSGYTYNPSAAQSPAPSAQYDAQGNYVRPQALGANDQVWVGEDGQYHCKRNNGTTGLVIGAALGGILGNVIAGHDNRTLGTIVGAVGGGLLGRSVEKGRVKCK